MAPLCNCKERDRFRDRKRQIYPTMSGLGISACLGWASSTLGVTTYFVISCWAPTAHTWPKLCKSRFAFSQEVCKSLSFGCNHCASRQMLHCFPRATWSCKRKGDCFLLIWLSEGSALTADDRGIPEITWDCGYGSTCALFMTLVASRGGGGGTHKFVGILHSQSPSPLGSDRPPQRALLWVTVAEVRVNHIHYLSWESGTTFSLGHLKKVAACYFQQWRFSRTQ